MKAHVLAAALLACAVCCFAGVKAGERAPEINLGLLLPERPVSDATLAGLAGKVVVLEFWATWCGPCVGAIPHLNDLAVEFKDRPVVFLSVTHEARAVVEEFLKKHPIQGWVGVADGKKLSESYGVYAIPATFLIDPAGKVAATLYPEQLTAGLIEDVLAGRAVDVPSVTVKPSAGDEAAPLAEITLRPARSSANGVMTGPRSLMIEGARRATLFSSLYQIPATRITGEGLNDEVAYDLSVSLPNADAAALMPIAREVVCTAFEVKAQRETRETQVLVLTAPNGKPNEISESTGAGQQSWSWGDREIQLTHAGMTILASVMESVLHKPVIDGTQLGGSYDLTLKYDDPDGMLEAVRKLGLHVNTALRPIEFLVVTPVR